MPEQPSTILGLTPAVVALSTAFVNAKFLGRPAPGGANIMDPLDTAWEAGRASGRPLTALNTEAAAMEQRQRLAPSVADVPGARVRARTAPIDRGL